MASDGSLKFDTKIDESGFKKGLSRLQKTGTSALRGIATATKVVSTAILGIGIAAAKVGADFEEGMSRVGAVSGATEGEMKKLSDTAKDLGKSTVFSATQAAEGMEYLAMAGFETTEIIDAMPGVLNTAAAGNVELGRAADITSNILSGFNLAADQSNRVADVMTKTFTSSNTTMESLGDTMKYVAPIANAAGFSIEEMAAAAGVLGDAGIQGSQAGMTLRNTILRLADPPKEAADALNQLGVSAVDASGEMKPFPQIISELDEATQGMTKAQKTAIISQIAGTQSAAGLMAILEQGGDTLGDFTKELENAGGTAEEVAAKQLDNLKGDIKLLQSALEGAGIAISENFDEALRGSVQFLTGYISQIAFVIETIDDFEQAMIAVSAILGEMFVEAIQAAAETVPMVLELAQQFMVNFLQGIQQNKGDLINAVLDIVESILNLFAEVLPAFLETGLQLVNQLIFGIVERLPDFIETIQGMLESIFTIIQENLPLLIESGITLVTSIILGLVEALPTLMEMGLELILTIVESIIENLPLLIESSIMILETIIENIVEHLPRILELALEIITTIAEGITENIPLLIDSALAIIEMLSSFIIENLPMILDAALEIILAVIEGLVSNVTQLVEGAVQIIESISSFLIENLPVIIDAALQIILAIMEGLVNNLDIIIAATFDIIDALITAIIQMLPEILSMGLEIIFSLADGILNNMPAIVGAITQIIFELIGTILGMLPQLLSMGIQLVGELASGVLSAVGTVTTAIRSVISSVITAAGSALKGMVGVGKDIVRGLWNGINDMTGWVIGKIQGFGDSVLGGIKSFFGISSPSKLFRDQVGEELVFGIGVGFEDKLPNVQRDLERDLDKFSNKMTAAVDIETNRSGKHLTSGGVYKAQRAAQDKEDSHYDDSKTLKLLKEIRDKGQDVYLGKEKVGEIMDGEQGRRNLMVERGLAT